MAESPSKSMKHSKSSKKLSPIEAGTTTKSLAITKKKELVQAVRATNPASVNTAPTIFWDVEGTRLLTHLRIRLLTRSFFNLLIYSTIFPLTLKFFALVYSLA